jgi:hypothetical protein
MILGAQLGQSTRAQSASAPFFGVPSALDSFTLLGNASIQTPASLTGLDRLIVMYRAVFSYTRPSEKLAALKREKFTETGREARIEAALAALNAPQPIDLTLAQWKAVLEEIDDED